MRTYHTISPVPALGRALVFWACTPVRRAVAAACAILLLAATPGCIAIVAGAAGAGTAVAYSAGKLSTELPASLDKTVKAAHEAVRQLGFAPISEHQDSLEAAIFCRTSADKGVRIELGRVGDGITKVEIRVGFFGDESVSLGILDKVKVNLGL
jgi:hypothetical protein